MKMAVFGEKYTSISPAGTKNFGGGRRDFRTGERTHGLISYFQGKVSATVDHTGNPDGSAPNASEPDLHF